MNDQLGQQFKELEAKWELNLPPQIPVIIRLDGQAFHTFTKRFVKPFSDVLHNAMVKAAGSLCKEIQNARFAYTQSDEISILVYESSERSNPWFGNRIQKICSVSASHCANAFNSSLKEQGLVNISPACFDARAFSITKDKIQEYFNWRQADTIRNSVSMLAQNHFSHRKLHKKNRRDMLSMLQSKGVNWSDLEDWKKNGTTVIKQWCQKLGPNGEVAHRSFWGPLEICPKFSCNKLSGFIQSYLLQTPLILS